jgi:hypothetical protein
LDQAFNAVLSPVTAGIDSKLRSFRSVRFIGEHHSMRAVGSTAAIATFQPTLSDVAEIFRHMSAMIERAADGARNLKFE